jgi:hypothetical protein
MRMKMTRIVFAVAVAGLLTMAVPGPSQAAPIAPLAGVTSVDQTSATPVRWWRHHRRHCWRGRWGRVHCRWW